MPVIVKICGITNVADALMAAAAGADALGFIFYEHSPRFVTPESVSEIVQALPPHIVKVGVFVNASPERVAEAAARGSLNILQFHGDESPDYCLQFGLMSMKAFRVQNSESLEKLKEFPTHAWLLDAYTPGALGGTGEVFDWDLAIQAKQMGRPVFLAGGLTPDNVARAVSRVQPYGVDVSTGVEAAPGRKDPEKVRRFIQAAKAATSEQ